MLIISTFAEQLLGVAWRNDTSFAACSTDKRICVYNNGEPQPVKTFSGYQVSLKPILLTILSSIFVSRDQFLMICCWPVISLVDCLKRSLSSVHVFVIYAWVSFVWWIGFDMNVTKWLFFPFFGHNLQYNDICNMNS